MIDTIKRLCITAGFMLFLVGCVLFFVVLCTVDVLLEGWRLVARRPLPAGTGFIIPDDRWPPDIC